MFYEWFTTDAKWYEFWMPQSGPIGGVIAVVIVFMFVLIGKIIYGLV